MTEQIMTCERCKKLEDKVATLELTLMYAEFAVAELAREVPRLAPMIEAFEAGFQRRWRELEAARESNPIDQMVTALQAILEEIGEPCCQHEKDLIALAEGALAAAGCFHPKV